MRHGCIDRQAIGRPRSGLRPAATHSARPGGGYRRSWPDRRQTRVVPMRSDRKPPLLGPQAVVTDDARPGVSKDQESVWLTLTMCPVGSEHHLRAVFVGRQRREQRRCDDSSPQSECPESVHSLDPARPVVTYGQLTPRVGAAAQAVANSMSGAVTLAYGPN